MKQTFRSVLAVGILGASLGMVALAAEKEPGFVDFGKLKPVDGAQFVEVNVSGNIIEMVTALAKKHEPEVADALKGLKRIRVNVRDRAITLDQIRVIYASGAEFVVPVARQKIEAGGEYGPIELKDGSRGIKEIRMRYRSRFIDRAAAGKGAAIVEVWGQH